MSVSLASYARDLGYTGAIPSGATNIEKNADGTFSITVNGKTQTYDASGSVFSPQAGTGDGNGTGNAGHTGNGGNANGNTASANTPISFSSNPTPGAGTASGTRGNPYDVSAFGFGFNGNQSGSFNAGYEIDPKILAQYGNAFNAMTQMATSMDFGLGSLFAQNQLPKLTDLLSQAVKFNFDFSGLSDNNQPAPQAATPAPQAATPAPQAAIPAPPETAPTVPAETPADPEVSQTGTKGTPTESKRTPATTPQSKAARKTKEEIATENGYTKVGGTDTYYDKKTGKYYTWNAAQSKFVEKTGVKQVFEDGSYIGTDGKKYDVKGNEISVKQKDYEDFDIYVSSKTSGADDILRFANKGWTKDSLKAIIKQNPGKYDIKTTGNTIEFTKKDSRVTVKMRFDNDGKIIDSEKVMNGAKAGAAPLEGFSVKYHENDSIAEIKSAFSGRKQNIVKYDKDGNKTEEQETKWMTSANTVAWVPTEKTTFGQHDLGNVSKYVPKFNIEDDGYSNKNGKEIVSNKAGTWSKTDNPNLYKFEAKDGASTYIVDATTGNIIQRTVVDKQGGKTIEEAGSSRVVYSDLQISQMFKEIQAAKRK